MIDEQDLRNLNLSKKQAMDYIIGFKITSDNFEETYKELVRRFYKANKATDNSEWVGKGGVTDSVVTNSIHGSYPQKQNNTPPLSPKQKICPKCKIAIPKTWRCHKECGWYETQQ